MPWPWVRRAAAEAREDALRMELLHARDLAAQAQGERNRARDHADEAERRYHDLACRLVQVTAPAPPPPPRAPLAPEERLKAETQDAMREKLVAHLVAHDHLAPELAERHADQLIREAEATWGDGGVGL